jgi:hypothetical protein
VTLSATVASEIEQAAGRNGFPVDPVIRGDWLQKTMEGGVMT